MKLLSNIIINNNNNGFTITVEDIDFHGGCWVSPAVYYMVEGKHYKEHPIIRALLKVHTQATPESLKTLYSVQEKPVQEIELKDVVYETNKTHTKATGRLQGERHELRSITFTLPANLLAMTDLFRILYSHFADSEAIHFCETSLASRLVDTANAHRKSLPFTEESLVMLSPPSTNEIALTKFIVEGLMASGRPPYLTLGSAFTKLLGAPDIKAALQPLNLYRYVYDIPTDTLLDPATSENEKNVILARLSMQLSPQDFQTFISLVEHCAIKSLFEQCIGKTDADGKGTSYTWTHTEWPLIRDATFLLQADGRIHLNMASGEGYLKNYAPGQQNYHVLEQELNHWAEQLGLKFETNGHAHGVSVFDLASSQKLVGLGLHLNAGYCRERLQNRPLLGLFGVTSANVTVKEELLPPSKQM